MHHMIFLIALAAAALPVLAQPTDETAGRNHFFPLIADGDGFQTILFIANVLGGANQCTLELQGQDFESSRFYSHNDVTREGARATIEFTEEDPSLTLFTRDSEALAFGYATIECAEPVVTRMLLELSESGSTIGMTTLPESRLGRNFTFPVLGRAGQSSLVISTNSNDASHCTVGLENSRGLRVGTEVFTIATESTTVQFLDDLIVVPDDFASGSAIVSCNTQVGALGLTLEGTVFSALSVAFSPADDATDRTHIIPLVVDGDGFRSHLFVSNVSAAANRCTLNLNGSDLDGVRFEGPTSVSFTGSSATFDLAGAVAQVAITSNGEQALAFGYASFDCDQAVVVRNLLTVETPGGLAGTTTISSSQIAEDFHFPLIPRRSDYVVVFANDTGAGIECDIGLESTRDVVLGRTTITIPEKSVTVQFIDELFQIPEGNTPGSVEAFCFGQVAALGLPLEAPHFAALPPVFTKPPDRNVTLPLLINIAGCSNGRFIENHGDNLGLVRDCRALVSFANTLIADGSTAVGLPVRQWGRGGQVPFNNWFGIGVFEGRVSGINLAGQGLRGEIPTEFDQLSALAHLDLSDNDLSGRIPPGLSSLDSLISLNLDGNRLSGEIPPALAQLSRLRILKLGSNRLTGPIPQELIELQAMNTFDLSDNFLSGEIPAEFWRMPNLETIDLSRNQLSGAIPLELGRLPRIEDLRLSRNLLSGPIPPQLAFLDTLKILELDNNQLDGRIPPQLGALANLQYLALWRNQLTGPIPPELANLSRLRSLSLSRNKLTGSIPPVLAGLTRLQSLYLGSNKLSGSIPVEFSRMPSLRTLQIGYNDFSGTLPLPFWGKTSRGELYVSTHGSPITGVEYPSSRRTNPDYAAEAAVNGNADFHSASWYQGPLVMEAGPGENRVEHQRPIIGRRTTLAVRINHEVNVPPVVITRVLDASGEVLAESLDEAGPRRTRNTGDGQRRSLYMFDLPAAMFRPGNRIVHVIDPENELAETNENDNEIEPLTIEGITPPKMRVTFLPIHRAGEDPPVYDPDLLMRGVSAYLPISDDFEATIGSSIEVDAPSQCGQLRKVHALWNLVADEDEFYHGIIAESVGGCALRPGHVAVSSFSIYRVIPHELGHNLSLQHPPGCGAEDGGIVDKDYPYSEGNLGPEPGWDVNWYRFVSGENERFGDMMSYCTEIDFISDYHYRKASEFWQAHGPDPEEAPVRATGKPVRPATEPVRATGGRPANITGPTTAPVRPATEPVGATGGRPGEACVALIDCTEPLEVRAAPVTSTSQAASTSAEPGSLALSGSISASGVWSISQAQFSQRGPRAPAADGEYTLILFDSAGVQLYEEPLTPTAISVGDELLWAARTPIPLRTAAEIVILDPQGAEVLRETLAL